MRVEPLTAVESLSTRETVPTPTPASAATLAIVLKPSLAPSNRPSPVEALPWKQGQGDVSTRRSLSWRRMQAGGERRDGGEEVAASWWRDGVLYQVYPRSFADTDADGVGDLRGIIDRLDHLEWLGVAGLWLNPTMPSPNEDWGYDVADFTAVHPELGTMEDLEELVAEAGRRGMGGGLSPVPHHPTR